MPHGLPVAIQSKCRGCPWAPGKLWRSDEVYLLNAWNRRRNGGRLPFGSKDLGDEPNYICEAFEMLNDLLTAHEAKLKDLEAERHRKWMESLKNRGT